MDQFNTPPKKEKPKHLEQAYVIDDLQKEGKEGWFSVVRFHGQTHLYIRQDLVDKIGKENIMQVVESIYDQKSLEDFVPHQINYMNSLLLELPPRENEKDDKVEQLIILLKNYR